MKTFRGGSDALTILVDDHSEKFIRKMIPLPKKSKLLAQFQWLEERKNLSHFPKPIRTSSDDHLFYLDIKYEPDFIHFFEYIHAHSTGENSLFLKNILDYVSETLYKKTEKKSDPKLLNQYLADKVISKVNTCKPIISQLEQISAFDEIIINGSRQRNLKAILTEINNNDTLKQQLYTFDECSIHGDLSIDNILVHGEDFLILDPNDENYISSPIVDYAKLYQSLDSGYEFLCQLDTVSIQKNKIDFNHQTSIEYQELFEFLERHIQEKLGPKVQPILRFHEAVHYARMLPYKAKKTPSLFFAFYAVMIQLFNQFLLEIQKK